MFCCGAMWSFGAPEATFDYPGHGALSSFESSFISISELHMGVFRVCSESPDVIPDALMDFARGREDDGAMLKSSSGLPDIMLPQQGKRKRNLGYQCTRLRFIAGIASYPREVRGSTTCL